MNDSKFNLIPEDLERLDRRQKYQEDPTHSSLKAKREKRDELKEKKFKAQQQKPTELQIKTLFLVDTKKIGSSISFEELMGLSRLLKRNYLYFSS